MSPFSVIQNPGVIATPPISSDRKVETGSALELLRGRQFHACNSNATETMPLLTPGVSGMFVLGANAARRLPELRRQRPGIPLIAEPLALSAHRATAKRPFGAMGFASIGTFLPLDTLLDAQRESGSDLAMTPTGQIAARDVAALSAAVGQANELDRTDTVLAIIADANWLSTAHATDALIREVSRSRHPVALGFADEGKPTASLRRKHAYRRVFKEVSSNVIAYRTDLFGMDAVANGAIASAIGAIPAGRWVHRWGKPRNPNIPPEYKAPHMLIGDLLGFVPSREMRNGWFVSVPPMTCSCPFCNGESISRLYHLPQDRTVGHQHNTLEIDRLFGSLHGLEGEQKRERWREMAVGALDSYAQLSIYLERKIKVPDELELWAAPAVK